MLQPTDTSGGVGGGMGLIPTYDGIPFYPEQGDGPQPLQTYATHAYPTVPAHPHLSHMPAYNRPSTTNLEGYTGLAPQAQLGHMYGPDERPWTYGTSQHLAMQDVHHAHVRFQHPYQYEPKPPLSRGGTHNMWEQRYWNRVWSRVDHKAAARAASQDITDLGYRLKTRDVPIKNWVGGW